MNETEKRQGEDVKLSDGYTVDSTLQHAKFLADSAERFLELTNNLHALYGEDGEEHAADDIVDAEIAQSEAFSHLRSAIYEFRKRV